MKLSVKSTLLRTSPVLVLFIIILGANRRATKIKIDRELVRCFESSSYTPEASLEHQEKASREQREKIVSLLKCGANPNQRDSSGQPLIFRTFDENVDPLVLKAFINAGANINARGHRVPDAAGVISDGDTPLFTASAESDDVSLDQLRLLLENHARTDIRNNEGSTVWSYAVGGCGGCGVCWVNPRKTELLLHYGVPANLADSQGETPLHQAVNLFLTEDFDGKLGDGLATVRILLKHGANPLQPNHEGVTPLRIMENWVHSSRNILLHKVQEFKAKSSDKKEARRQYSRRLAQYNQSLQGLHLLQNYVQRYQKPHAKHLSSIKSYRDVANK